MNAKIIAERLRRLAKYEIPSQPFTSRELKGIITDIADELDPPEPKPLLADAKVGDLCQRMDGKWVQVDSYSNDRPCPVMCKSDIGGQDCFTLDGRNHNAINDSKDIIHTEPLAEVGSAEWAWQMLKIGRMVTDAPTLHHYEHNIKTSMVTCVTNRRGFRHSARSIDTWGEGRRETGWQLYEEPAPAFKVGDWVRYDIDTYLRVIEASGAVRTLCKTLSGTIVYPYTSCLSKLVPSEVIVKIGCLKGTVKLCENEYICPDSTVDNPCHFILQNPVTGYWSAICFKELAPDTAALVKALLKAQEEK